MERQRKGMEKEYTTGSMKYLEDLQRAGVKEDHAQDACIRAVVQGWSGTWAVGEAMVKQVHNNHN